MRSLVSIGLCVGCVALVRGQTPLRLGLVSQPDGAPVALVATHTVNGRAHGAVTVRNVSPRAVSALTFVVTIGDPTAAIALRRTETVPAVIKAGATLDVALPGISASTISRLLPSVTEPVAELAIVGVTFADGARWRARDLSGWIGHPGQRVTAHCLDSSNAPVATGASIVDAAVTKQCTADGLLLPASGGLQ